MNIEEEHAAFNAFMAAKVDIATSGRIGPFLDQSDYIGLLSPPPEFLLSQMVSDHLYLLTQGINQLRRLLIDAEAWHNAGRTFDADAHRVIMVQYMEPPLVLALSCPYALKSRFIVLSANILHLANNRGRPEWTDELPIDRKITLEALRTVGNRWSRFSQFDHALSAVNGQEFLHHTKYFRNRWHHQYGLNLGFGLTPIVRRRAKELGGGYEMILMEPPDTTEIVRLLWAEHQKARDAFMMLHDLLGEVLATVRVNA